jgi:hypothetical protein
MGKVPRPMGVVGCLRSNAGYERNAVNRDVSVGRRVNAAPSRFSQLSSVFKTSCGIGVIKRLRWTLF